MRGRKATGPYGADSRVAEGSCNEQTKTVRGAEKHLNGFLCSVLAITGRRIIQNSEIQQFVGRIFLYANNVGLWLVHSCLLIGT
jgi:hypothetical protein